MSVHFMLFLLISRWCWSCLSALYSYAAYYRGAMGILLVYDVTDESSFNSKFSYCLSFTLWILRNHNILSILLLFYCQCVLFAFSVFWVWATGISVSCLIYVHQVLFAFYASWCGYPAKSVYCLIPVSSRWICGRSFFDIVEQNLLSFIVLYS